MQKWNFLSRTVSRLELSNVKNNNQTISIDKYIDNVYCKTTPEFKKKCPNCGLWTFLELTQCIEKKPKILNVIVHRGEKKNGDPEHFAFRFPRVWVPKNSFMSKEFTYQLSSVLYSSKLDCGFEKHSCDIRNWSTRKWSHCDSTCISELTKEDDKPGSTTAEYFKPKNQKAVDNDIRKEANVSMLTFFERDAHMLIE